MVTLDGIQLESVTDQKDLGVIVSYSLKPKTQIETITKKAYQKTGMIKRCITNFTTTKVIILYKTIIRHELENVSPTWNPWLKSDIGELGKVQRKRLNMCTEPVQMDSLQFRRNFTDLMEIYEYMNNMYKTPASCYFTKPAWSLGGHPMKLHVQFSRTDVWKHVSSNSHDCYT